MDLRTWSLDLDVPYSHADWHARIRASAGVGVGLDEAKTQRFDTELANLLAVRYASEPMRVPHRLWVLSASVPGLPD